MDNLRVFSLLTLLVLAAAIAAIYHIDISDLSAYGSVFAAAGSFVAVIWFSGSLRYQARQLYEQRTQFLQEFKKIHEDGRRNALILAREILISAEQRALSLNPGFSSISEIFPAYMNFLEFKPILESKNPDVVKNSIEQWMKKEGPALALMKGLKQAAQVYFTAIGKDDVDYSKPPEQFVFIYGFWLWELPFFESFQAPASPLAEIMIKLEPGRGAVKVASFGVMVALGGQEILDMEGIRKDVTLHKERGYPVPKIAENLLN